MLNAFLVVLFFYVLSLAAGLAMALHVARSWHTGFFCSRPLSRFAKWHPAAELACFSTDQPWRGPNTADKKKLLAYAAIPVVNVGLVLFLLAATPVSEGASRLRTFFEAERRRAM